MRPNGPVMLACLMSAGLVSGCAGAGPPQGRTPYEPSAGMSAVLAEHQAMRAKPLSGLSLQEAREVPTLVDAMRAMANVHGLPAATIEVARVQDLTASGAAGPLAARLYRPAQATNTPTIVFFPGGTWARLFTKPLRAVQKTD